MKEEAIRPDYLMRKERKLYAKDLKQLLKHKKGFIKIPCPACELNNYHKVFEKGGFNFVACKKCETIFINPRPTPEMLAEFYVSSESIKFWNDKIFPVSESSRRNQIFKPRAEKIGKLCKKYSALTGILFDVGAGFGTFCEEIKKLDLFDRVVAVEPSRGLAETCRRKGIDVIEKTIEEIDLEKASVITNFELIEHIFCPKDFLLACNKGLRKGGLLFTTTSNIKGFDLLILNKLSNNVRGPNHLNYFNAESFNHLLSRCGFETIEIVTPGKLDAELVRKKILSGDLDISNNPFLKHILIDQWDAVGKKFQQFLVDNKLSSHMWAVARKK